MPFATDDPIFVDESSKLTSPVLFLSMALFALSLCNSCFCTQNGCRTSAEAFFLGWLAMMADGAASAWLANPLLILAWVLLARNKKAAWIPALGALLLCILFLKFHVIIEDEAGHYNPILKIRIGYWLWLSSVALVFLGSLTIRILRYTRTHNSAGEDTLL
jgi:hypothetical protein